MAERRTNALIKPFLYSALFGYLAIVVYPMVWLLYTSLKTDREIFLDPFSLPDLGDLQWINFTNAWTKGFFGDYFLNSVLLTVTTVAASMLLAAMAAYALARFTFPGVRPLFFYFLAGLMIPLQLSIVPLFFQMKDFGLLNSRLGLLIVYVAFGMPFAIFILTGFFRSLPSSLHESALMDGAGEFRAFWSIMLPLARPGLITVGIFSFLGTWNDLIGPLIFLKSRENFTVQLGLAQFNRDYDVEIVGLMAGSLMSLAPPLAVFMLAQKYFVRGITLTGLKG